MAIMNKRKKKEVTPSSEIRKTKVASPAEMAVKIEKNLQLQETFLDQQGDLSSLPKKLGRYPVLGLLGFGGMGSVYLAFDRQLEREVAVKVIRKEFARSRSSQDRFNREAKIAASIDHPNIVKVFDWGTDEDHGNFIVLEYIKGETLREKLKREGPMSVGAAIEIITALAQSLCAMSQKKIVHRDIKPGNILLSESGNVKLTDLGIAKNYSAPSNKEITRGGSPGTPDFMAPEQKHSRGVDIRADIYSMGKTFIFLLTGKSDVNEIPLNKTLDHFQFGSDSGKGKNDHRLLKKCLPIILKMVEDNLNQRYQTPEELLADLQSVRNGHHPKSSKGIRFTIPLVLIFATLFLAIIWWGSRNKSFLIPTKNSAPNQQIAGGEIKETMKMISEVSEKLQEQTVHDYWTSSPLIIIVLPMRIEHDLSGDWKSYLNNINLSEAIKSRTTLPIVDRESLTYVLREFNLETSDLTRPDARLKLRQVLPASILIEPIATANKSEISLNIKLVNIETTEIVGFLEEKAPVKNINRVQEVFSSLAESITQLIHMQFPIQGKIISLSGNEAEINIGSYHGLKEGSGLDFYEAIQTVSGQVKPGREPIARGKVTNLDKFNAYLDFESEKVEDISLGMLVAE